MIAATAASGRSAAEIPANTARRVPAGNMAKALNFPGCR
jgi:hypothetical protein